MRYKLGCFKCGEETVKDLDNTFNRVSCQLCGNENNMSELLLDKINDKDAKIQKLEDQLAKLNTDWCWCANENGNLHKKIEKLEMQLEKAVEVAKFYANKDNWEIVIGHTSWKSNLNKQDCAYLNCGGGRARVFLETLKQEKL